MRIPTHEFGAGFQSFGRFIPMEELPGVDHAKARDFSGGYDVRDAEKDVPRNSSPYAIDVEVSSKDAIVRAPGIRTLETYATRTPEQLLIHSSLSLTAELLLLDAPFLGKYDGTSTVWTDHGLAAGTYAWTNYGEDLIFSPGHTAMYRRAPGGVPSVVTGGPPAKAYANFAGRIIAGHTNEAGALEPMGLIWNGSSALYTDWAGAGSGYEILLSNRMEVDYIQSLIPLGFDLLAIVCRRSLWVATRTGIADRPLDPQVRIEGHGAVNRVVSVATPFGVAFLGDDGVSIFNGNSMESLSDAIRADLVPLDFDNVDSYELHYHPSKKRLLLITPTDVWVYDFPFKRWYRRSAIVTSAVPLGATQNNYDMYFLGLDSNSRTVLGLEDAAEARNFDRAQTPIWEFPLEEGDTAERLISTSKFFVDYLGTGTIEYWQPNIDGDYERVTTSTLGTATGRKPKTVTKPVLRTGLGLGLQLRISTGTPEIYGVEVDYIIRGPKLDIAARAETLIAVKTAEGYWVFLPYDEVAGLATGGFVDAGDYLTLMEGVEGLVLRRETGGYVTVNEI